MSKKTKRQVRKSTSAVTPVSSPGVTVSTNGSRAYEREFSPDYSPVIKDLKRIGTLAGSFFVLLIVLSFFLR